MEHLGGEGSIAGTSSVIPSMGAPLSPQFSSLPTTPTATGQASSASNGEVPSSPPTASEVGQAAAVQLGPPTELEGRLADVSAVLSSPPSFEAGGPRDDARSPAMASLASSHPSDASSASQNVPAGGVYSYDAVDDDDNDADDGGGLVQFPIERRVPTFDLDDEDDGRADANDVHQYPATPSDDASHSTATADETDLMGLFSGNRGGDGDNNIAHSPMTAGRGTNAATHGRIDPDTSGLRLDLDGLSGYDPHPPTQSSPESRSKWDEARLTKSSSGGYPVQAMAGAHQPQDAGGSDQNLPVFVRKAQQRQQQDDEKMQSDASMPPQAKSNQAQRRRPRPWDDLNETSVHDDTYDDDDDAYAAENGYATLTMQQQRDGAVPPNTLQDQPKENTPLLSNQRRRQLGNAANIPDDGDSNANGNSWSSVGASMRFRNPLQSRRSATPVSYNGSGSGSGSGAYAASAIASTVHTETTTSTAANRFKWRPGGDLMAHAGGHDDDAQSWTAGSVVKEFVRPLWNRHPDSDGIGRSPSFAYALTSRPQSKARFSLGLATLCCLHFGSMTVFDLYYLYFNWSTETDGPAPWLSSDGFLANPLVGPPASTLTYFGALSGIRLLYSSEMWRVLTSLSLSTSLLQLALHLTVLQFGTFKGYVAGLERRWSSKATFALYLICCFCGAASSAALDYPANLTGLVSAGLCGLLSASLAEGWLSSVREMRADRLDGPDNGHGHSARSSLAKILLRPGKAHLYIGLELATAIFPYSSLWAVTGGLLSGLACGMFHFSYLLDNRDMRPKYQAYGPAFSTPSKKSNMFGTPPHSPSPSDTPPMRRSMMATPDQDENGFGDASSPYRSPTRNSSHFSSTPPHNDAVPSKSGVGTVRLVGFLLALLVGVVPGALVATGAVGEAWGSTLDDNLLLESSYGCRDMKRLFQAAVMSDSQYGDSDNMDEAEESEDLWVCSQSCVPITLISRAGRSLDRNGLELTGGRCRSNGYLCQVGTGSQELHSGRWWIPKVFWHPVYKLPMDMYAMPGEDETCADDGQQQDMEVEENQMQAFNTAPGNARAGISVGGIAIDIAEEVAVNAGL